MQFEEVPNQNALQTIQEFDFKDKWQYPERSYLAREMPLWSMFKLLSYPTSNTRKSAFLLGDPGIYRHTIRVMLPEPLFDAKPGAPDKFSDGDSHFRFNAQYATTPTELTISADLAFNKSLVTLAEWPGFIDKLLKLRPRMAPSLKVPVLNLPQTAALTAQAKTAYEAAVAAKENPMAINARMLNLYWSALIDSGHLPESARAQAFDGRGVQRSLLGDARGAAIDFKAALELAPDDAHVYSHAAINAFAGGQDEHAQKLAERTIALAPGDAGALRTRMALAFYAKEYGQSRALTEEVAGNGDELGPYAAIWLYLAAQRDGKDGNAEVASLLDVSAGKLWPYSALRALMGKGSIDDASKDARTNGNDARNAELLFYMGEQKRLSGDKKAARLFLEASLRQGMAGQLEYRAARRSLDALNAQ
jgi:lipoprotein NlpI